MLQNVSVGLVADWLVTYVQLLIFFRMNLEVDL